MGLSRSLHATSRKSVVTNPCAALNIASADCPRYRSTNMEVIELDTGKMISWFRQIFFSSESKLVSCYSQGNLLMQCPQLTWNVFYSNVFTSNNFVTIDQMSIFIIFTPAADFGSTFSGALTDEHGRVKAIWGSFSTQVCTDLQCL